MKKNDMRVICRPYLLDSSKDTELAFFCVLSRMIDIVWL